MKVTTRTSSLLVVLLLTVNNKSSTSVFATTSRHHDNDGSDERNTATKLNQRRRMIRQQENNHHDVTFEYNDHQQRQLVESSLTASFVADGFLTTPTNKDHMTTTEKIDVTWEQVVYELFPSAFEANISQTKQLASDISLGQTSVPQAPYMNLGHAKQGTTTTHSFFNCLHQKPCHCMIDLPSESPSETTRIQMATCFYEAKKAGKPLLSSCGYPNVCDSYHQMENPYEGLVPQLENLYDLVEEVPQMTLMLPFRNFESWLNSQTNWSANRSNNPGMMYLRDNNCPFVGLKAFESSDKETIGYGAARQPERFIEQKQKQHWLLQSLLHKESTIFDEEARQTILNLLQYHGIDEAARSALFYVYFITYVRNFARLHPQVKMIEFDLDDSQTTSDLFQQIFQLSPQQKKCWRHVNTTPQVQQQI